MEFTKYTIDTQLPFLKEVLVDNDLEYFDKTEVKKWRRFVLKRYIKKTSRILRKEEPVSAFLHFNRSPIITLSIVAAILTSYFSNLLPIIFLGILAAWYIFFEFGPNGKSRYVASAHWQESPFDHFREEYTLVHGVVMPKIDGRYEGLECTVKHFYLWRFLILKDVESGESYIVEFWRKPPAIVSESIEKPTHQRL